MYTDKNGDLKCCKSKLCNGICCDEGIGEVCIDGTCKIGCPNLTQLNSGLYTKCGDKDNVFTGTPVNCDDTTSICLHDCTDTNKPFKCIPKSDCWKNTAYTPNLLLGTGDNTYDYTLISGPYKGTSTKVAVCQNVDKLWISNTSGTNLNRSVSVDADPNYINQPSCNVDTCISKISEYTSGVINYDKATDKGIDKNNTNITNNICNSQLSCTNSLLEDKEMQNLCTLFDKDTDRQGRCCKKNDNTGYTGQICAQSGICINDISGYTCYGLDDKSICNNNGTLQKDRTCKCDFGYIDINNQSTCLSTIDVNQFTQPDVVNLLNNIDYIKNNYKSDFISYFTTNASNGNYILVYCLPGGKYANFKANGSYARNSNFYNTEITNFHTAIYGEDKGDLIISNASGNTWEWGIGFWYDNGRDTGTCTGLYVSTDSYGTIDHAASNFTYGNPNSKLFENVINSQTYLNNIRLGVLLIGPTTKTCP